MALYQSLYRQIVQRIDPERAHALTLQGLATTWRLPGTKRALATLAPDPDERLRQRIWDLPFANPLGLAAGVDKNGLAVEPFMTLGFSHVEVGTVTLRPQPGNDRPRLWRVPEEQAIINSMGFPNDGAAAVHNRLAPLRPRGVLGVNIGKNKQTPDDQAAGEYADLVLALFPVAQYITINVSSPNTPGLRALQFGEQLREILTAAQSANAKAARLLDRDQRPILVKIAPDLIEEEVETIAGTALDAGVQGIIATNTTVKRDGIPARYTDLPGGLSGPPLRARADQIVRRVYRTVEGQIPIIGVGGISSSADALARIRAGASLIQIYSAFTYQGPTLPRQIIRELSADADQQGWKSIRELIGIDA